MDNHPIPQDITGFQFKLIGDMTVKQFAYVATGVVTAWLLFTVLPFPLVFKIAFALPFAAVGAALAFVPIGGRPMDLMISNFFKAVFSPTQYIYQKKGEEPQSITSLQNAATVKALYEGQFRDFVKKFPKGKNKLDQKEETFFQNLNFYSLMPKPGQTPVSPPSHMFADKNPLSQKPIDLLHPPKIIKQGGVDTTTQDLKKTAELLERELVKVREQEAKELKIDPKPYLETHQKVLELQKQLNDMLSQKQQMEQRLVEMQKSMQGKTPVYSASVAKEAPMETKNVRSIPSQMTKSIGLPSTPEFPNVLTGIVKDPRGNPLSNVLVEVKDEQGNAVRAFKTNALGRFASATALNNGAYTIEFEDQNGINKFDSIAFKAEGKIIMPIEVISTDAREELRKSLFN